MLLHSLIFHYELQIVVFRLLLLVSLFFVFVFFLLFSLFIHNTLYVVLLTALTHCCSIFFFAPSYFIIKFVVHRVIIQCREHDITTTLYAHTHTHHAHCTQAPCVIEFISMRGKSFHSSCLQWSIAYYHQIDCHAKYEQQRQNPKLLFYHKLGKQKIERVVKIVTNFNGWMKRIKWKSSPFYTLSIDFSRNCSAFTSAYVHYYPRMAANNVWKILPQYYIWWQFLL